MARSGDTKLLCHLAQMIIALSGGEPMASQRWQIPSFVSARGPALREPRLVNLVESSRPAGAPRRVVSACTCRRAPSVLGTTTPENP
jgi:hypothetical protein